MLRRHQTATGIGTVHFVTTVTRTRGMWFVEPQLCVELLAILENYRHRFDLDCYGYVLMPDHLHALLLQTTDLGTAGRLMEHFKRFSSRKLLHHHCKDANGWRELFDDVFVPGSDAVRTKLSYLHGNPVRGGLVHVSMDYPWSSARYLFGVADMKESIVRLIPNPL
ncbi:hypothetical protein EHM69_09715 [candidate division KSB1 bacterium]|nr:MAG: hypothetical protein EHM69_09715 [candidate division KSB1 bacterium]